MRKTGYSLDALLLCFVFILSPAGLWASADEFQAGVNASKAGQFELAIHHFLEAEKSGKRSAVLYHNLGVAYFKTGQYNKAFLAFERAEESPKLAALSFYNRGLVQEARNNHTDATRWFEKAHAAARSEKLRRLAEVKLGTRPIPLTPYVAYIEASAGYDSNPQLVDETYATAREESDVFVGTIGYGRYHLRGDNQRGIYLIGSGYLRRYPDLDNENMQLFSAGAGYLHEAGQWQLDYQLTANRLSLGDEAIQHSTAAYVTSRKRVGGTRFIDARAVLEDLNGRGDYNYLSGERYQLRLRYGDSLSAIDWRVHYEITANHRGEQVQFAADGTLVNRYDVSPTQHHLGLTLQRSITPRLEAEIKLGITAGEYEKREVRSSETVTRRKDNRHYASLAADYHFDNDWIGRAEVNHWSNDSTFDAYDYQRNTLTLSLSRSFF